MSEPTRDLHALTAQYFDGELEGADEQAALAHLAGCPQCQAELGDFMGLEVALQRPAAGAAARGAVSASSEPDGAAAPPSLVTGAAVAQAAAAATTSPRDAAASPGDAASSPEAPVPIERARAARARRWLAPVAITATLAAAAGAALLLRARPPQPDAPRLALAATRGVEARFTAAPFTRHRPYEVVRGSAGREDISLAQLAALERRGERAALVAAQAVSGDLERARAQLLAAPPSAPRDADLAAAELMAGRPELALEAADRALAAAPALAAAQWNRALALRELGLTLTAAAAFDEVSRGGEAGWAAEATAKATALRAAMADRAPRADAFQAAAKAMVAHTGPALTAADVAARPGHARLYFLDALRSASSRAEALELAPLAEALDQAAGNAADFAAGGNQLADAVARVAAADFAVRAPLALAYRALASGEAPGTAPALLARLAKVPGVEDLRLGAMLYARTPIEEVAPLLEATGDPWFLLHLQRERAAALWAAGEEDRAETELRTALAGCDQRAWAFRCAQLADSLMQLYADHTRYTEYETYAELTARLFRASGTTEREDTTLLGLAEARRVRGRFALAAATFREAIARLEDRDCVSTRYATYGLTMLSVYRTASLRGLDSAAAKLAVDACHRPPDPYEVGALVDLARMTGRDEDRARAATWIEAAGKVSDPLVTAIARAARARLDVERDPDAAAQLRAQLPALTGDDETSRGFRAWIYQTLVDDAGRRGAWPEALAVTAEELGIAAPARCALAVSLDDTRGVAVAIGADGAATGARASVETPPEWDGARLVPAAVRAALAGCPSIAVIARPPLHGRADLLPPELPWAFQGQPAKQGAAPVKPPSPGVPPANPSSPTSPAAPSAPPPRPPGRELFIGDALPPPALTLPALAPMPPHPGADELRAAAATPAQVLSALATASYAEFHVHGQVDLGVAEASFLALSPGADQRWALTAAEVRTAKLLAAPVIVLAACRAAATAPYEHKRWSLPDAFLEAGARAVIAPTVEIPDTEAVAFFAELRARLTAGEEPAAALAAVRRAYVERGAAWAASVVLFR